MFILKEPILNDDEYFMNIETIRCLKAGTNEILSRKENEVCQPLKINSLF